MNDKTSIRELLGLKEHVPGINDILLRIPSDVKRKFVLVFKGNNDINNHAFLYEQEETMLEMQNILEDINVIKAIYKISYFSMSGSTTFYPLNHGRYILLLIKEIIVSFYSNYAFYLNNKDFEYRSSSGIPFRIHYDSPVECDRFAMRIHQRTYPKAESLVLPLGVYEILMSDTLSRGGMGMFIGEPGGGKSTVMAATLVSRLEKYGGPATTAENPRELLISGQHGEFGWCDQYDVSGDKGFEEAAHNASRQFPSQPNKIFLFGEINTATSARTAIQLALNGVFVLMTSHGSSIGTGISRFVDLATSDADGSSNVKVVRKNIASAFKFAVHQEMHRIDGAAEGWGSQRYVTGIAHTMGTDKFNNKVMTIIEDGDLNDLDTEISSIFLRKILNPGINIGQNYKKPKEIESILEKDGYNYLKHCVPAVAYDALDEKAKLHLSNSIKKICGDLQ